MARGFVGWNDLNSAGSLNPLAPIARQARNVACTIRQQNPWLWDRVVNPDYFPLPALFRNNRQAWDNICQAFPVSNQEPQGFNGGQCPVFYIVRGYVRLLSPVQTSNQNITAQGPLQGIRWRQVPYSTNSIDYRLDVFNASGVNVGTSIFAGNAPIDNYYFTVERQDGQPDSCGNRGIDIPIPILPPPITFNIQVDNGGQRTTQIVTLPGLVVNNWPDFQFSPTFDLGGVTAEFNLDGITLDFGGDTPWVDGGNAPVDLTPVLTAISESEIGIRSDISAVEANILDRLDTIDARLSSILDAIRCCCCESGVTFDVQSLATDSAGGRYPLPSNTVAVIIQNTSIDPSLVRTQDGSGSAPTVFYWGWNAVCYGNALGGTRTELSYLDTSVECSTGATSVIVNPTHGTRANVSAIIKNKNCETE